MFLTKLTLFEAHTAARATTSVIRMLLMDILTPFEFVRKGGARFEAVPCGISYALFQ